MSNNGGNGNNGGNNNNNNNNNGDDDRLNVSRRQAVGLGGSAILGGLGIAGIWPEEIEIDGYESDTDFDTHRTVVSNWNEEFDRLESEYKNVIEETEIDDLLDNESDIRVGDEGELSTGNSEGIGLDEGVLENPEYILSQDDGETTQALVSSEHSEDLVEQTFTNFNSGEFEVDSVLKDLDFATDSQKEAAKKAAESASKYSVFAATSLNNEQPIARPSKLQDLKENLSEQKERLEDAYSQVIEATEALDGYENNLSNALAEAKQEKSWYEIFDNIKDRGRAEKLLSDTRDVLGKSEDSHGYQDLANQMAKDMARYEVLDRMVGQAHDTADEIWESNGYKDLFVDLDMEVKGNRVAEGIRVGEVDNWSAIDDETIGSNNYLQSVADDLGMSADEAGDLIYTTVEHDGRTEGLFVNPDDHSEYEVSDFNDDQLVYDDLMDGSWDGGQPAV